MNWVAIDFETAASDRSSACSIGLAVVENGRVVERVSRLIQPPGNHYAPWNIRVHGIRPSMTSDAPGFEDLWPDIEPYITDRHLVAHNAPFDLGVLRACLSRAEIAEPRARFFCTLGLARRLYPDMGSHTLPLVADRCRVDLFSHHDAAADAEAAALIAASMCEEAGAAGLTDLADRLGSRSYVMGLPL